ncbi:MAG: hypothetical protein ACYSUQ_04015 [Planctomycetota bacterium]|jgi:hypothetical protein
MSTKPKSLLMLLALSSCVGAVGCHHAFGNKEVFKTVYILRDGTQVGLIQRVSDYPDWADAELTYSDVSLELQADSEIIHRRILGRREHDDMRRHGPLRLDSFEMRIDSNQHKLWVVDKAAGRVVASHDRETKATTGFGEQPPAWADPHQGVSMGPAPPS